MKFISKNASYISIILVLAMNFITIFVDKKNTWNHWSWFLLILILISYLIIELLRHKEQNLSVEDRFKIYLLQYKDWEEIEENKYYYKHDPNFVVEPTKKEPWMVKGGENWVRAAINPTAFVRPMQLRHSQTIMKKIDCIYYDEIRYLVPAPKVTGLLSSKKLWFYSLCADNSNYFLAPLLLKRSKDEIIEAGFGARDGSRVPVAVFKSKREQSKFEEFLTEKPIQNNEIVSFSLHKDIEEMDREIISYSYAVLDRLVEYRKTKV